MFKIWVVMKKMRITRKGKSIRLQPGDQVPEAGLMPKKHIWFSHGHVKEITVEIPEAVLEEKLEEITGPKEEKLMSKSGKKAS